MVQDRYRHVLWYFPHLHMKLNIRSTHPMDPIFHQLKSVEKYKQCLFIFRYMLVANFVNYKIDIFCVVKSGQTWTLGLVDAASSTKCKVSQSTEENITSFSIATLVINSCAKNIGFTSIHGSF